MHIESPNGLEQSLRWFYGDLGQLDEVEYSLPDGQRICFKSARIELRIRLTENPEIIQTRCRVTLAVTSLDEVENQLIEKLVEYEPMTGLMGSDRRIGTYDPAGNRVEFKQEWPICTL